MAINVLITKADKGIGEGLVKQYLSRPDTTVIATVRDLESTVARSLAEFSHGNGSRVVLVKLEARSETDSAHTVSSLVTDHGLTKLDVVIANSGVFEASAHQGVADMNLSDLQYHIDVNAYGTIRLFRATWPLLQRSDKPIFLLNSAAAGSLSGQKTYAHFPLRSYALSKAVANLITLRLHFEHQNLIAFAVHPGSVVTENRTAIAAKLGVPVEGILVEECVTSLVRLDYGFKHNSSVDVRASDQGAIMKIPARELADIVTARVDIIDTYLRKHDLAQPSFAVDSPRELPEDVSVQRARLDLIEAASALSIWPLGPPTTCVGIEKHDDTALHVLARFDVFNAVPAKGSVSYSGLAEKTGLNESRLRRILNQAFTIHYFYSPAPDHVAHTSNSAVAIGDPLTNAWILHNFEEVGPWYANTLVDTIKKWGDPTDPKLTGPNLYAQPGKEKDFFALMEEDGDGEWNGVKGKGYRLWRLQDTDKFFATEGAIKGADMHRAFDWKKLGKATVVDICGIAGHLSIEIASKNPDLTFVVQDKNQSYLEQQFHADIPVALKDRVRFQPHNILEEQPIKKADVYFLRTTLHEWPDAQATAIISRIVEAMDPAKSRVVTMDLVLDGGDPLEPDSACMSGGADGTGNGTNGIGTNKSSRSYEAGLGPTGAITRLNVGVDLQMMAVLNARERTKQEWIDLFKAADPRFVLKACKQPIGNCASMMEWVLE